MAATQTPRQRFEAVFPVIADEILAYMSQEGMPQDARDWMKRVRPPLPSTLPWFELAPLPPALLSTFGAGPRQDRKTDDLVSLSLLHALSSTRP